MYVKAKAVSVTHERLAGKARKVKLGITERGVRGKHIIEMTPTLAADIANSLMRMGLLCIRSS